MHSLRACLALLATAILCTAQIPRHTIQLNSDTFEKATQASTGQTTGTWFVLFNDASHFRAGEANAIWMQLAMDEDKEYIVAEVFLHEKESRALAWQFAEVQPPSAVLFKYQKMYTYPRPIHEQGSLQKLNDFANWGYEKVAAQNVPGSIYGKKAEREVQQEWVDRQQKVNNFGETWKTAAFGLVCLFIGFKVKNWAKGVKAKEAIEAQNKARELAEKESSSKEEATPSKGGKKGSKKGN